MIKIQGMELDIEKSSDGTNNFMWSLYFTEGLFEDNNVSKTTEPVLFRLKRTDYQNPSNQAYYIYYNPYINKYNIIQKSELECQEKDVGYNIGGFMVLNDCRLVFVYPKCTDTVNYNRTRSFDEEFDESFENRTIDCDGLPDLCGAFREINFNNDFEIGCPIIEDGNEFDQYEFDDAFTID